jgi:SOS-response transcriptional repressor LexA
MTCVQITEQHLWFLIMETYADRINSRMKELGIKQADIMRATGAGRSTVHGWVNGVNAPNGSNLTKLASALNTTSSWIISGESAELEQNQSQEQSQPFVGSRFKETIYRQIPVLDFVQAGDWRNVLYDGIRPIGYTVTDYKGSQPNEVFGLIIDGQSMTPQFNPSDLIVIDPNLSPNPGDYVVAQKDDEKATFKKYRVTGYGLHGRHNFELKPLNPDFPVLSSEDAEVKIIGVMVRHTVNYK